MGNRLYENPNKWSVGQIITAYKFNKLEKAVTQISKEIVDAAGYNAGGQEINLGERLDLMRENFDNELQNISIDPDDLGLEQDEEGLVYVTFRGVKSALGIPLAGGSGGGGGAAYSYKVNLTAVGERVITVPDNSKAEITFTYTSVDNDNYDDGPGICTNTFRYSRAVYSDLLLTSLQLYLEALQSHLNTYPLY